MRILLAFLMSSLLFAQEWGREDTAWETACLALQVVDWGQTRNLARHPTANHKSVVGWVDGAGKGWLVEDSFTIQQEQTNLFLPKHPSVAEVDRFFIASLAGHYLSARLLRGKWRRGFQLVTLGMTVDAVDRNVKMNLHVKF